MFIDDIVNKFNKTVKLPYYNVRSCPRCGSRQTGRYVKSSKNPNDNQYTIMQSLKNGEIVEVTPEIPEANAFCMECGFSWPQYIRERYVTVDYIKNQKKARGTAFLLDEEYKKMYEEESAKDKKYGKATNTVRKFIGKL